MSVSAVVKNCCVGIGEGPHWDEKERCLYYVDINGKAVHRYDPATGQDEKRSVGMCLVTSLAIT